MTEREPDADLRERLRALPVEEVCRLADNDPGALAGLVLMDLSGTSFMEDPTVWRRWAPLIRKDDALYAAIGVRLAELRATTPHEQAVIDAFCGGIQFVRELPDTDFEMWLVDTISVAALERRRTITIAGTAFMQAREASETGNYERAATLLDRALAGYSSIDDRPWIAHCFMSLGNLSARQSNYAAATQHFQEALETFRGLGDQINVAGSTMNLAYCLYEGGHGDDAYRAALATIPEVPVHPGSAEILERVATLAMRIVETRTCDDPAKVGMLLDLAKPLIAHSPGSAGQPLLRIATSLGSFGALEDGYNVAREAMSRLGDESDVKHEAVSLLTMLGSGFMNPEDLRADLNRLLNVPSATVRAGELILRLVHQVAAKELSLDAACAELTAAHSVEPLDETGLRPLEFSIRGLIPQLETWAPEGAIELTAIQVKLLRHAANLAGLSHFDGVLTYDEARLSSLRHDYDDATAKFQRAGSLALSSGNAEEFITMCTNASLATARGGAADRCEAILRDLLKHEAVEARPHRKCELLRNLASSLLERGEPEQAIEAATRGMQTLELVTHPPQDWRPPRFDRVLGHAHKDCGRYTDAIMHFQKAVAMAEDDRALARDRGSLASVFLELGDLATARALYEQAFATIARDPYSKTWDHIYAGRAVTLAQLGDFANARAMAQMVLENGSPSPSYTNALVVMFDTASSDEDMDAIARRMEALLTESHPNDFVVVDRLVQRSRDEPARLHALLERLKTAATGLSGLPRVTFTLRLGLIEADVFGVSDATLGKLRDALREVDALSAENPSLDVRQALYRAAWPAVVRLVASPLLDATEALDIVLASKARGTFDATYPRVNDTRELTSLLSAISDDVLVVEMIDLGDRLRLFFIDRNGKVGVNDVAAIRGVTQLAEALGQWDGGNAWQSDEWTRFSAAIGAALEPHLRPGRIVSLVPSNAYGFLPLHACTVRGVPLADTHGVVYGPSAAILKRPGDRDRRWAQAIAVGRDFESEAEWVASHLGGHCITGGAAEPEVIARSLAFADAVHFSCHGQYAANGAETGLKLANGGWLTNAILRGHSTTADLVTLAACETAVHYSTGANDLVGLDVTFLNIGATSVLGTLWSVEDSSAEFFVRAFYRHLMGSRATGIKQMTKAEAWRRAVAEVKGEPRFKEPFFWAPFKLSGGWL